MIPSCSYLRICFFFNDTATTEIYTLSLHDALPILDIGTTFKRQNMDINLDVLMSGLRDGTSGNKPLMTEDEIKQRSEEHTSELQSRQYLVCRLLLEKKTPSPCILTSETDITTHLA